MKNIFAITAILLIITATANKAIAITEPDSIHSYQYINKIRISNPERAMTLCDEAVELDMMEPYMAWYFKGIIYDNKGDREKAFSLLKKVVDSHDDNQNKTIYASSLNAICQYYQFEGKLEDALQICTEGIDFTRQQNDMAFEGQFMTNMGLCLIQMDKIDEGFERLKMAEEIFDVDIAKNNSTNSMQGLIDALFYQIRTESVRDNDNEVIRIFHKYEQTVMKIMDCHIVDSGYADINFVQMFPIIAFTYERLGNHEEAEKYFNKFELLVNKFNSPFFYSFAIPYLGISKQYDKALTYNKKYMEELQFDDTISKLYIKALSDHRELLDSIGDYKNAFNTLKREMVIQDSIYKREKHQISIEMATAYQVKEKEAATALAQQKVKWLSVTIVLLIVIIVSTIAYSAITIRRTKALAKSIKERIDNEDLHNSGNDSCNTPPAEDASSEPDQNSINRNDNFKALFKKMDELVKNEKLYLNPNLQRDDLAKMVNISKNDFANFIQQNAGCNTNTYINNLRLEYAVRTLVHEPEYKISAVAELSGIPNLSTFYRLFTERYGITPVKFAKNIAAN